MDAVRRAIAAADIWIQDHYWFVVISVLLVLGTGTGLLLEWRGRRSPSSRGRSLPY